MERPFSHLAIVGASVRAAAESVYLSGRTAVAADLFADADLRQLCHATEIKDYPSGLAEWLERTECDAWIYTGALENHPNLIDGLARIRPLLGNAGDVLRQVRDPLVLQQKLHAHGLPFPETHSAEHGKPLAGDWLVKTYRGSSGSGVRVHVPLPPGERLGEGENPAKTPPSLQGRGSEFAEQFLQRQIQGQSGAAIFAGETLLGVSRQLVGESWTGAGVFQYCGSIAPWSIAPAAEATLQEIGRVLADEFQLQGLYGVDFIDDGQEVWPVEVNPRYTASVEMIELAYSLQAIDWHLSTCSASNLPQLPPPSRQSPSTHLAKAIWFAKIPLQITALASSWALSQRDLSDIPVPGTTIDVGDPVLTVRTEGWTAEETLASLQQRIIELESRFGE